MCCICNTFVVQLRAGIICASHMSAETTPGTVTPSAKVTGLDRDSHLYHPGRSPVLATERISSRHQFKCVLGKSDSPRLMAEKALPFYPRRVLGLSPANRH